MKRRAITIDDLAELLAEAADGWLGDTLVAPSGRPAAIAAMVACLAGSVILLAICVPVLLLLFPLPLAISIGLAVAAVPLAAAGVLAAVGSPALAGYFTLLAASLAMTILALASGGMASPFLALLGLLPYEAARFSASRRGLLAGALAAGGSLALVWIVSATGYAAPLIDGAGQSVVAAFIVYGLVRGLLQMPYAPQRPLTQEILVKEHAEGSAGDALDRLPGLVTIHDPRGHVTRVTGADREEFICWMGELHGQGFLTRIHVSDRIAFLEALDGLRRGESRGEVRLRMESACGLEQGQFIHVAIDLIAERDGNGCFLGAIAQSRDISNWVAARSREAEIIEQAESANAAKTRFLAAVSHELRTPLNAIIGFSDILAREYFGGFSDERQREYVGLIHQSGEHLLSLVNTMLDMSKIEAGRYDLFAEPFRIGETLEKCGAMLGLQASRKNITLARRVAKGTGEVVADHRAIQQILINLIGNSIKFTQPGGVITVDAKQSGDFLYLSVSDTGIGIPADKLARIGEPFMQVQNSLARDHEGTGLGLSLVKGLVSLHGGTFSIDSQEGEGTTVTICIPMDGSGVQSENASDEPAVFPPNLPAAQTNRMNRKEIHDEATARSA